MTDTQPKFAPGDRVFSHYVMAWGTVEEVDHTTDAGTHGVTGSPLPASTWYRVKFDDDRTEVLDDGGGDWELARIIPPNIATRYGWGTDPKEGTIYAKTTDRGTAAVETALCAAHYPGHRERVEREMVDDVTGPWVDCTDNTELACIVCGRKGA